MRALFFLAVALIGCSPDPEVPGVDDSGDPPPGDSAEDTGDSAEDTGDSVPDIPSYSGGYNVGDCEAPPVPTGPSGVVEGWFQHGEGEGDWFEWPIYEPGDVVDDFSWRDQHGEEVSLYAFCGHHVMMFIGDFT